jgi:hypothetical protein
MAVFATWGFGAEDVQTVEPLLVTYNQQEQIEGVKYDRLTVVLVNAIKEQQLQLAAQQTQMAGLKAQLANVLARLEQIEREQADRK